MAEKSTKKTSTKKPVVKPEQAQSQLIGAKAEPTILQDTTKLDIDVNKTLIDNIIEASSNSQLNYGELDRFTMISNYRDVIYQLIETMMRDSSVSSIVRTFTADVCETSDNGHIVYAESSNPKISKFVNYLLNIMNVDKNINKWVYSLIEYGDLYLRLYRESDYKNDVFFKKDDIEKVYSVRNILNENIEPEDKEKIDESIRMNVTGLNDHYSYYIEMVPNPGTMFELTRFGQTCGYIETPDQEIFDLSMYTGVSGMSGIEVTNSVANYRMKSGDVNIYQATEFVHAYLEDSESRYPEKVKLFQTEDDYNNNTNGYTYSVVRGKSLLYDSYKVWREKSLLEAAILLTRLTRSSLIQKVQVEVGDMPKEQTKQALRRIKELFEQKTALKPGVDGQAGSMQEYTNPGAVINTVYLPTHNGQGAVSIESVGGDINIKDLADLDNWINKFYASYGIPKQYFGETSDATGFNGGSSLTIISSVYARQVKRIQSAIIQALTDAINLCLIDRGYKSYLNNFVIKMKAPLTQEEKDYRENLTSRVSAISNINSLFTDIKDKPRRLRVLKELIATLGYGDNLTNIIQEEIKAAEEKNKQAEEEGENEEEEETDFSGLESLNNDENIDAKNIILTEDNYDVSLLNEDEDLPTPEELNKDFTVNS